MACSWRPVNSEIFSCLHLQLSFNSNASLSLGIVWKGLEPRACGAKEESNGRNTQLWEENRPL